MNLTEKIITAMHIVFASNLPTQQSLSCPYCGSTDIKISDTQKDALTMTKMSKTICYCSKCSAHAIVEERWFKA